MFTKNFKMWTNMFTKSVGNEMVSVEADSFLCIER